jgi:nucleoside-diphosphate-sugar epimerase
MALHVIVGKGAVGRAVAAELVGQGHEVRVVSRSGGEVPGTTMVQLDAADAAALTKAATGAAALYNCANPRYHEWSTAWPPLAEALLTAAERTGATLAITGNLYPYGPVGVPMREGVPDAATDTKGRIRAGMWAEAQRRHWAGRLRAVEARASDFYGPGVAASGHLGELVVPRLMAGKAAQVIGDPDLPHSFTYVPDLARALVRLAGTADAWGRVWHVPTAAPITRREGVRALAKAAGIAGEPKVTSLPWPALRTLGVFRKDAAELWKMRYQWQREYVLDSAEYERTFGEQPTPMNEGFAETVAWWKSRA